MAYRESSQIFSTGPRNHSVMEIDIAYLLAANQKPRLRGHPANTRKTWVWNPGLFVSPWVWTFTVSKWILSLNEDLVEVRVCGSDLVWVSVYLFAVCCYWWPSFLLSAGARTFELSVLLLWPGWTDLCGFSVTSQVPPGVQPALAQKDC